MIRHAERVFVDTGAWIALAEQKDPCHPRAAEHWRLLQGAGARLFCSVPVMLETFTFLDRRGSRELALRWKRGLKALPFLRVLECTRHELDAATPFLEKKEFRRLSLVDATSFVLMHKHRLHVAFTFDTHFSLAGFRCEA